VVARPDDVCPQQLQPVSRARASSPWSTRPAATPRHRSPLSSRRCPPIRFRRPGSGCPAVRCPVSWGGRPEGPAVGRLLSTHPASNRPASNRPASNRPASAPVRPDASVSPTQAVAFGTGSNWPGDRDHRNGWRPLGLPRRRRLDRRSRRPGLGRRCRRRVGPWGWVADPGRRVRGGPRRPRLPAERPGRPGRPPERPSRAAALWARCRRQRKVEAPDAWLASPAGRDHGGWSSPSLTLGWAAPEGPGEGPAGMGVRPQRGPSRRRALPARCRQRCDLRRWLVGLPGLEPGTSSLSGIEGSALCGPPFSQVTQERQGRRDAFLVTSFQAVQASQTMPRARSGTSRKSRRWPAWSDRPDV